MSIGATNKLSHVTDLRKLNPIVNRSCGGVTLDEASLIRTDVQLTALNSLRVGTPGPTMNMDNSINPYMELIHGIAAIRTESQYPRIGNTEIIIITGEYLMKSLDIKLD